MTKKLIYIPSYLGYVSISSIEVISLSERAIFLTDNRVIRNVPQEHIDFIIKVMGAYYEN